MKIKVTIPSSTYDSCTELVLMNITENDDEILLTISGKDIYVLKENLKSAINKF